MTQPGLFRSPVASGPAAAGVPRIISLLPLLSWEDCAPASCQAQVAFRRQGVSAGATSQHVALGKPGICDAARSTGDADGVAWEPP